LSVPALMPANEEITSTREMRNRMREFLADLVPASVRGRELGQRIEAMGAISLLSVEYEHVVIDELRYQNQPFGKDNRVTVTFKKDSCRRPTPE